MGKETIINFIKWSMKQALRLLNEIDSLVGRYEQHNEQYVLDFYDKINEISVRK